MKYLIYEDSNKSFRIVNPHNKFDEESDVEQIIRLYRLSIPLTSLFIAIDEDSIPKDRTFRDAWIMGDINEPIKVDFSKALEIHRKRIQEASKIKIKELTIELKVAEKALNTPLQVAIKKTIEILTMLHGMNLTHCKTVYDIKKSVPKELHDVWTYYQIP